ncbi:oma1 [Scenedesmus sp. PABB004]|nr:oma1 [Scenedesmus sp. PABB004]
MRRAALLPLRSLRSGRGAAGAAAAAPGSRQAAWTPPAGSRCTSTWVDKQGYEHFGSRGPAPGGGRARLLGAAAALGGASYWWSCRQEVPYTHRHHAIMMVSNAMELHIGQQTFQEVTSQAAGAHTLLPASHHYSQLVRRVGARIAQVAADGGGGGYSKHMRGLHWEYAVINSPDINAFVAPGGKVVVFTGLLQLVRSEDELAAVLAHETGHVLARHHAERLSQLNVTGLANLLVRALLGVTIPGALVVLGIFLPYSRAAEYEADAIGIRLLARACYDPQANVTMLAKLNAAQGGAEARLPEMMSTHPLTEERVARVRALLPEAFALYKERCSRLRGAFDQLVSGW